MKDFDEMNLSLVTVGQFLPEALYCIDDSPLQNQTLFPGCYGICANPDVSGIGNRISLYIQTILTLWLATLTPHPDDTLGAMLAGIAASFTVFVATLAQYAYNNITFHHTLITINLSALPTVAFFAGILRLRLQPGVIPMGPKLFATPIMLIQFIACAVSVFLGVGLNSIVGGRNDNSAGRGGSGSWEVAQPQCNNETKVIIFGRSLRFWVAEPLQEVSGMTPAERVLILVVYGIIVFLPFLCSFVCLYLPETGTLRAFAHAFHQERRTNKFALFAFFILSNAWVMVLIYANETQIRENKVLAGESQWGSGQILAMLLCIIPLLGCIKIFIQEVGNRNRKWRQMFKRARLHRFFGVRFESNSATSTTPVTPAPGTPRRSLSRGPGESKDLEDGLKSPDSLAKGPGSLKSPKSLNAQTPTSPRDQDGDYFSQKTRPEMASRRLSKRDRYSIKRPEDIVIVSPGEDSGPEDAPGSGYGRRPRLGRESTLVDTPDATIKENKRERTKSVGSIAGHSVRSISGNVKVIVHPDGRMSRVLSRRNSMVGGGEDKVKYREDDDRPRQRRRLSKSRPDSRAASRKSDDDDGGYWSAVDDHESTRGGRLSRRDSAANDETIRRAETVERGRRPSSGSNKNDDPLSKYYWDPQRGWLERK